MTTSSRLWALLLICVLAACSPAPAPPTPIPATPIPTPAPTVAPLPTDLPPVTNLPAPTPPPNALVLWAVADGAPPGPLRALVADLSRPIGLEVAVVVK